MAVDKVFVYLVRMHGDKHQLLVFRSHDEPGFEVPKGSVVPGESIEDAARRELLEESGISAVRIIAALGTTVWRNERQCFVLAETEAPLPDVFRYTVTGTDTDCGLRYEFQWRALSTDLEHMLVQGCDRFVCELRQRFEGQSPRRPDAS